MQLRVLGPLVLRVGPQDVEPGGRRPRDVLAVLATRRGRTVTTQLLRDAVWPDGLGTDAVVHTTIARLRRRLGSAVVRRSGDGYVLTSELTTDADLFAQNVAEARTAGQAGRWREQEAACRAALDLWSGMPYEGVPEDLVLLERARLDDLRLVARTGLVEALLEAEVDLSALEEAWLEARALLADDPLDERIAVLAMRAAQRLGRQAEAYAVYDATRRALRAELGVDPGPGLQAAHAVILHQQELVAPVRERGPRLPSANSVPVALTPTIGREADLAQIEDLLNGGMRVVTLVGPGGVGKSRLLAELAARLTDRPGVYVALGGSAETDVDAVARAIADGAGVRVDGANPLPDLVTALRTSVSTLLLDEAEWATAAVATCLATVLPACPGVRVVLSSRSALGLVGERLVPVGPLDLPTSDDPAAIRSSAAVRLLVARLADRAVGIDRELSQWPDAELRSLADVVRRVDGMPLAIELVAGRVATEGLAALDVVSEEVLDLAPQQQASGRAGESLRETMTWSLTRLAPDERTALRRLSTLVGTFDSPTAKAVIGTLPGGRPAGGALQALIADNLVHSVRAAGSAVLGMRVLRPIRDLALAEMDAADRAATARRRREWFATRWRGATPSDDLVIAMMATQEDQVVALGEALHAGDVDTAADLVLALSRIWLIRESNGVPMPWVEAVLAMSGLSAADRARLLVIRSVLVHGGGWGEADVRGALRDDPDWLGLAVMEEGIQHYQRGDLDRAIDCARDALAIASSRARHHCPECFALLAAFHAARGDVDQGRHHVVEALAVVGPSPSLVHTMGVLPKVALAQLDLDQPAAALALLEQVATTSRDRLGLPPISGVAINAGWAALACGDAASARQWFSESLRAPGAAAITSLLGEALCGLGAAFGALGDPRAGEALRIGSATLTAAGLALTPMMAALVEQAEARIATDGHLAPTRDLDLSLAVLLDGQAT